MNHAQSLEQEEALLNAGAIEGWNEIDTDSPEGRAELARDLYHIMKRAGIKPPGDDGRKRKVKVGHELYSRIWLRHYYNFRSFQPCYYVAANAAHRVTGEWHHTCNERAVDCSLDYALLFAAQKINRSINKKHQPKDRK